MPVKDGDYVLINYTIKIVEDGQERVYDTTVEEVAREAGIYDENRAYRPVWVKVDPNTLVQAVYEEIRGMEKGQKKEILAEPDRAYGEYNKNLVIRVPIKRLRSKGITPRVGETVKIDKNEGVIIRVTDRFAYIDFNHPLAGKTLKFEIEVLDIAENDLDLARGIAGTLFRIGKTALDVSVEEEDDKLIVKLSPEVLFMNNLEIVFRIFLEQIYEKTKYNKVEITIPFEFKRKKEAEEKQEEAQESTEKASSGAEEAEKGAAAEAGGGEG